jgi:hypothetical protein
MHGLLGAHKNKKETKHMPHTHTRWPINFNNNVFNPAGSALLPKPRA